MTVCADIMGSGLKNKKVLHPGIIKKMQMSRGMHHSLHGNSRRHRRGQLDSAPALHQLDGLFHLHLVVEGNELRLLGALARNQALLHVLLVEAVQPARRRERKGENKDTEAQPRRDGRVGE